MEASIALFVAARKGALNINKSALKVFDPAMKMMIVMIQNDARW
jgi:hypothetical protein